MTHRDSPHLAAGHSASINWHFIGKAEGDVREPYVPVKQTDPKATLSKTQAADLKNYRVILKSGPTVATGVDLGQQDLRHVLTKVTRSDLRDSIQAKIGAFAGAKNRGAAAIPAMDRAAAANVRRLQSAQPELMSAYGMAPSDVIESRSELGRVYDHSRHAWLKGQRLRLGFLARTISTLTEDESRELDRAVKSVYTDELVHAFDRVGKAHGATFANLPPDAQTALMSIYYNKGVLPHASGKHKKFWHAMLEADFDAAATAFDAEFVKKSEATLVGRRKAEMKLLQNAAAFKRTKKDKSVERVKMAPKG